MGRTIRATRRGFLAGAASTGAGLTLPFWLPDLAQAQSAAPSSAVPPPDPNAFLRIATDNTVTVILKHLDKGQGVATGLATIAAEELDADWSQVRTEFAPANGDVYRNFYFGGIPFQGTGVSSSIANSWTQLRRAGAAARAMLVEAAAQEWKAPASEIVVERGVVRHTGSGRTATFGSLAVAAAKLPVPQDVTLKNPARFALIGKDAVRLDAAAKSTGQLKYGLDLQRPGMLIAMIQRAPRFGANVRSFDDKEARNVPGVVDIVQIPQGVAVLAKDTWSAIKGRRALNVVWDESSAEPRGSVDLISEYKGLLDKPAAVAITRGDAPAALKSAARTIDATYTYPYLAHAPMEPLNCIIEGNADGGCTIWAGSQLQSADQFVAAKVLGVKPTQVKIETQWAGGSFGRRANPVADLTAEAASLLKVTGAKYPIKLMWTREDDIKGGFYRSLFVHRVTAGLDAAGNVVGWQHRIVGQSIAEGTALAPRLIKDGVDATSVEGGREIAYAIPNVLVDQHTTKTKVPVLWWRSVGHSHNGYSVETMMDELAAAAGKDPVAFRLALLSAEPRLAGVLRLAAEKAGWGAPLPKGRGRGVAVMKSYGSYVAHIAEVTVSSRGVLSVDRFVIAVDCGIAINPDNVVAQIEGGAGYALSAALAGEITLTAGAVDQSNFDGYQTLRFSQMPKTEVHLVTSTAPPTGIGEPAVPTVAPAIANAIFAATGKRVRDLPFSKTKLT